MKFWEKTYANLLAKQTLRQLIVLASFTTSFILVRIITHLQRAGILPEQGSGGTHIHHLVLGIIMVLLGGYVGIVFFNKRKISLLAAAIFGIGAALTLDEFALWLDLKDVYWQEQGRLSIDAVVVALSLMLVIFIISSAHDHRWGPFKKIKSD